MSKNLMAVVAICCAVSCNGRNAEALQGEWLSTEMWGWFEFNLPPSKAGISTLAFSGNEFSYDNGYQCIKGTYSCDTTRSPNEVKFLFRGRRVLAIYSCSGDALEICVGESDDKPPMKFSGGPKDRPALIKFKKKKRTS